jgi:hypothetical protein
LGWRYFSTQKEFSKMPEEKKLQEYKPRWYKANVIFEVDGQGIVPDGAISEASVTIQNVPFLFRRLSANNRGRSNIDYETQGLPPGSAGFDLVIPTFWEFTMRTDSHVYMSDPVQIMPSIGSTADLIDMPSPVKLYPKATVTFNVQNLIERTDRTVLQFVLAGVEPAEMYQERL